MKAKKLKWKIQIPIAYGWADLKSSINDGDYTTDLYETEELALEELNSIKDDINDFAGRIVQEDIEEDGNLYD